MKKKTSMMVYFIRTIGMRCDDRKLKMDKILWWRKICREFGSKRERF